METLGDIIDVRTNCSEADFWIERRGDEMTVGKPSRQYLPHGFGVIIRDKKAILPGYMYYLMEYLWRNGTWHRLAKGTTRLVSLRASNITSLAIERPGARTAVNEAADDVEKHFRAGNTIREEKTSHGEEIVLKYRMNIDDLTSGTICDGIEAYRGDQKVGYIKFDYTTKAIMAKAAPHIWAYASLYAGICVGDQIRKPYSAMSWVDLIKSLKGLKQYRAIHSDALAEASPRVLEIYKSLGGFTEQEIIEEPGDVAALVGFLKICAKKDGAYGYRRARNKHLAHHLKPFVAYVNTAENTFRGLNDNNTGRGIGALLYKAAAIWIAERGIAPGIYASSNQSPSAKAIWEIFEKRGWVVKDGTRRYLDAAKIPPLN